MELFVLPLRRNLVDSRSYYLETCDRIAQAAVVTRWRCGGRCGIVRAAQPPWPTAAKLEPNHHHVDLQHLQYLSSVISISSAVESIGTTHSIVSKNTAESVLNVPKSPLCLDVLSSHPSLNCYFTSHRKDWDSHVVTDFYFTSHA